MLKVVKKLVYIRYEKKYRKWMERWPVSRCPPLLSGAALSGLAMSSFRFQRPHGYKQNEMPFGRDIWKRYVLLFWPH